MRRPCMYLSEDVDCSRIIISTFDGIRITLPCEMAKKLAKAELFCPRHNWAEGMKNAVEEL